MRLSRSFRVTSLLAAAALTVTVAPASADDVGVLQLDQVSGVANGFVQLPYNSPGTPLLDHFYFRDVNDDQHLAQMTVRPTQSSGSGAILVNFADKMTADQYEYRIAHQRVSAAGLNPGSFTDICRGQCTRRIVVPPGNFVFVITGFDFEFTTADHHIDAIGIRQSGNELTHWFNDKNNDDEYRVRIDYQWVPRSRFASVSSVSGTVHAAGSASRDLPSGNKVVRGFYADGLGTGGAADNHIKRFGFLTHDDSVDIYYGDKNPADSADWTYRFDYGVLN